MRALLIVLVFVIGLLQPVQASMNAELHRRTGHPLQAAMVNMAVGATTVLLALLVVRMPLPSWSAIMNGPRWALGGGLIGATLVTVMLYSAPRLGVALLVAVFIVGQIASSVTIDHFGLLGLERRSAGWTKIVGLAFLLVGVVLVERSGRG